MNIFLACCSKKLNCAGEAQKVYCSDLFKKSLEYAKSIPNAKIYILSAKYGLLELTDIISPYNITLNKMSNSQIEIWANKVLESMKTKNVNFCEKTIFLCGENYRKHLLKYFSNYEIPLQGLGIGKQLAWYKNKLQTSKISKYSLF